MVAFVIKLHSLASFTFVIKIFCASSPASQPFLGKCIFASPRRHPPRFSQCRVRLVRACAVVVTVISASRRSPLANARTADTQQSISHIPNGRRRSIPRAQIERIVVGICTCTCTGTHIHREQRCSQSVHYSCCSSRRIHE